MEIEKLFVTFSWKCKGPRNARTTLKKCTWKFGGTILSDFKIYYKFAVIKTCDIKNQDRWTMEQNRETRRRPFPPTDMVSWLSKQKGKVIWWRVKCHFNKWCWKKLTSICKTKQKQNFNSYLTIFTKIKSQCIMDLSITPETITFLEENVGENLSPKSHKKMIN